MIAVSSDSLAAATTCKLAMNFCGFCLSIHFADAITGFVSATRASTADQAFNLKQGARIGVDFATQTVLLQVVKLVGVRAPVLEPLVAPGCAV